MGGGTERAKCTYLASRADVVVGASLSVCGERGLGPRRLVERLLIDEPISVSDEIEESLRVRAVAGRVVRPVLLLLVKEAVSASDAASLALSSCCCPGGRGCSRPRKRLFLRKREELEPCSEEAVGGAGIGESRPDSLTPAARLLVLGGGQ